MFFKHLLISILLLGPLFAAGQKDQPEPFDSFAQRQYRHFIHSYENRDVATYNKLLTEWLQRYSQLSNTEKKKFTQYHANVYYNLCCTYALLGNNNMALEYLGKSIQAGYGDYTHLQQDKDLDSLRKEERFKTLVQPLRETGDYRYILKKAKQYNYEDKRALPAFTYQPPGDSSLIRLRKGFHLDSVAGKGNDVSQVLNVLHWVHTLIPHDGNHENPAVKNALSMIAVCQKDNRGLNCRGLATVLNECYLSLGFRSRLVTCLPKDSLGIDADCHVINMVYIPSLKKWIWADPTHDAYVMNEKGELLSIEEVRQRLINDEPLILNPTANWNYRESTLKENYLYNYMAKNLYLLECPVNSQYDNETAAPGKTIRYIQLVPLDYFKQVTYRETRNQKTGTNYVFYNTNNPAAFWQVP